MPLNLIIASVLWVVLLIMWIRVLIGDTKLTKINERLHSQLHQALKEIWHNQSKFSSSLDIQYQSSFFHREKGDSNEEDIDSLS